MSRKIEDTVARVRMIERGILPDADVPYPTGHKPWPGTCLKCGDRVQPRYNQVVNQGLGGCYSCRNRTIGLMKILPDADARKKMVERGILPDADIPYPGASKPWSGTCLRCGERVVPMYSNVVLAERGGCQYCGIRETGLTQRHPDTQARKKMIEHGVQPDIDAPYPGAAKHWSGTCLNCGDRVMARYSDVIATRNYRCSGCTESGMKHSAPSYVYLLINDELAAVKIGIANVGSVRPTRFSYLGWRLLKTWNTEDGYLARAVEQQVLDGWRATGIPPGVTVAQMAPYRGASETAPLHMVDEYEVLSRVDALLRAQRSLKDVA